MVCKQTYIYKRGLIIYDIIAVLLVAYCFYSEGFVLLFDLICTFAIHLCLSFSFIGLLRICLQNLLQKKTFHFLLKIQNFLVMSLPIISFSTALPVLFMSSIVFCLTLYAVLVILSDNFCITQGSVIFARN